MMRFARLKRVESLLAVPAIWMEPVLTRWIVNMSIFVCVVDLSLH